MGVEAYRGFITLMIGCMLMRLSIPPAALYEVASDSEKARTECLPE